MYHYKTKGTCSKDIYFNIVDNKITNVKFLKGCNGNLKVISDLVEGMSVEEAISKFKGITCGHKKTSCVDQLAKALIEHK